MQEWVREATFYWGKRAGKTGKEMRARARVRVDIWVFILRPNEVGWGLTSPWAETPWKNLVSVPWDALSF